MCAFVCRKALIKFMKWLTSLLVPQECPTPRSYKTRTDRRQNQPHYYQLARPYASGPPVLFSLIWLVFFSSGFLCVGQLNI